MKEIRPNPVPFRLLFYSFLVISVLRHLIFAGAIPFWQASQWVVSYEESGVIPRAFIGTIMRTIFTEISLSHIWLAAGCVFLLYLATLIFVFEKCLISEKYGLSTVVLLYTLMPVSAGYYLSQAIFARFDLVLFLLACFSVFFIRKDRVFPLVFVPLLSLLGVLIHESYLVLYFPLTLSLLAFRCFSLVGTGRLFRIMALVSSVLCVTIYLLFVGRGPAFSLPEYILLIQQYAKDFTIESDMIRMQYYWTPVEHLSFAFRRLFRMGTLVHILIALPLFLPLIFLTRKVLRFIEATLLPNENARHVQWLFFVPVIPLLMSLGGIDIWRWVAASLNNCFLIWGFLLYRRDAGFQELLRKDRGLLYAMVYLAVVSSALGVMNETTPFLWVNKYEFFKAWFGAV